MDVVSWQVNDMNQVIAIEYGNIAIAISYNNWRFELPNLNRRGAIKLLILKQQIASGAVREYSRVLVRFQLEHFAPSIPFDQGLSDFIADILTIRM